MVGNDNAVWNVLIIKKKIHDLTTKKLSANRTRFEYKSVYP